MPRREHTSSMQNDRALRIGFKDKLARLVEESLKTKEVDDDQQATNKRRGNKA